VSSIVEFYGATEGNVMLFNNTGRVGAVGFIPRIVDCLYPVRLLSISPSNQATPLRDASRHTLCQVCSPGEIGLLATQVDEKRLDRRFDGYCDDIEATHKKVLRDVVNPGDAYFNSGDLLTRDWLGFFFWVDRVGDTYRWKGENVSSTEIENMLSATTGVEEVCVYGVIVPGCEGKAGMAALSLLQTELSECGQGKRDQGNADIVTTELNPSFVNTRRSHTEKTADSYRNNAFTSSMTSNSLFWTALSSNYRQLPSYAAPVFVRLMSTGLQTTSTHKLCKADLVEQVR